MSLLITNGYVWDGVSTRRRGDVLIADGLIKEVSEGSNIPPADNVRIIDATNATVIPGMVDAHSHASFPTVYYPTQIEDTPPEETLMSTMHNVRLMLDSGFTGLIGAGSPKLRSEIVISREIKAGRIPGPRLLASTPTLTTTGGLNDSGQLHQRRDIAGMVVDGVDECRRAVRTGYREGVDVVKVNASGDDFFPRPASRTTTMTEAEFATIADTAHRLGLVLSVHARSAEAVKIAVKHGARLINHADFADEEALDALEEAKDRIFVAPTIGFLHGMMHDAANFGFPVSEIERMDIKGLTESNVAVHRELHKRGVRAVIGGDYGVAWQPHGTNARDVEHFVDYFGFSPEEALRSATTYGALAMGSDGQIKAGSLADVLVVRGDPTLDPKLVQTNDNFIAVIRDGKVHSSTQA